MAKHLLIYSYIFEELNSPSYSRSAKSHAVIDFMKLGMSVRPKSTTSKVLRRVREGISAPPFPRAYTWRAFPTGRSVGNSRHLPKGSLPRNGGADGGRIGPAPARVAERTIPRTGSGGQRDRKVDFETYFRLNRRAPLKNLREVGQHDAGNVRHKRPPLASTIQQFASLLEFALIKTACLASALPHVCRRT